MAPNQTGNDQTPDADLVAANERAKDSRILPESEALDLLTGGGESTTLDTDSSEQGDEEEPRKHPDPMDTTEDPDVGTDAEDSEDADEGSPTDDTKESDKEESDDTKKEEAEDAQPEQDFFIGLGEDGQLGITPKPTTPTDEELIQRKQSGDLTDVDRVRLWQATADKAKSDLLQRDKEVLALQQEVATLKSQLSQVSAKSGEPFGKRVSDFLDDGEEFVPEDQADPGTPSGRAYTRYADAYRKHEQAQLKNSIKAELEAERAAERQKNETLEAVEYLRTKRKGDYDSDDAVEDLVKWSQGLGKRGFLILSIARDIDRGTFKISQSVAKQLAERVTPSNGNTKKSIATKPDAKTAEKSTTVDSDMKTLSKLFPDAQAQVYR